jgi:CubicO group peptidase (beta-lactamase class C family)
MTAPLVSLPTQPEAVPWPTKKWSRAPLDARLDGAAVDRLFDYAFGQPEALGQTNALIVVQRGAIVAERSVDASMQHMSWSMAKSVLHAGVGILVREGRITVERPADVEAWCTAGDPRAAITLDQLLTMRSGLLFCEDYIDEQISDAIEMLFGGGKPDVAGFAAAKPLEHTPGTHFSYSSGTSNIVSQLIGRIIGGGSDGMLRFLASELFERIGMSTASPRFDEAGTWIGSSFLDASAEDFARFGLLYLRDGVWNGDRLLPAGWVDYARTSASVAEDGLEYGAHWWIEPGDLGVFRASGYNGQRIAVVPALDLVIVRLGVTPIEKAPELQRFSTELIDAFRPARA